MVNLKVGKVSLLYKPITSEILEAHLARYHISTNNYKEFFDKTISLPAGIIRKIQKTLLLEIPCNILW